MANDWRVEIADYLKNPSQKVTRKLRYKSIKYVLLHDQLYYKTVDGVLLKCLNQEEVVTPSVLRPKPTTKSCHEHRVCVIMHVIEGVDKFLVAKNNQ